MWRYEVSKISLGFLKAFENLPKDWPCGEESFELELIGIVGIVGVSR